MKKLNLLFVAITLLSVSFNSHGQAISDIAYHDVRTDNSVTDAYAPTASAAIALNNVRAVDYLRSRLKASLVLPDFVTRYEYSGEGAYNVWIDKEGLIQDVVIVKTLGRNIDMAVIKAINKIEKVEPIVINGTQKAQIVQLPLIIKG